MSDLPFYESKPESKHNSLESESCTCIIKKKKANNPSVLAMVELEEETLIGGKFLNCVLREVIVKSLQGKTWASLHFLC